MAVAVLVFVLADYCRAQACGHWEFMEVAGPGTRFNPAMVFDSVRQETVLFGGWDGQAHRGDTWAWNGSQWNLRSTQGPPSRQGAAMAFDSWRGVVVMFGGRDSGGGGVTNDTWEWNGQEWSQVATTGPEARTHHSMAFDARRGVTVLYGNILNNSRETWEWDGAAWMLRTIEGPGLRRSPQLVYDERRGEIVLHGGYQQSITRSDTWVWDGDVWTRVSTEGPRREEAGIVFDSHRGRVLLHGGQSGSTTYYDDTWEWDGQTWTQLATDPPIPPRTAAAMAYDAARGESVLFGGAHREVLLGDTWIWNYHAWIDEQPRDSAVVLGRRASFSLGVERGPVTYQWRRDGLPLEDFGTISGSHTPELTISRTAGNDAGLYDCVIQHEDCEPLISRAARLFIVDPLLAVDATCPQGGPIAVNWSGATPDGPGALILAAGPGSMRIPPGRPCAGTRLGLDPRQLLIVWQGVSNAEGHGSIEGLAGAAACGRVLQFIDLESCTTSDVLVID